MPTDESQFLHKLEAEVQAELVVAESSESGEALATSPAEWLFDPADVEREEVGLRNLLGAVEALELGSAPVREPDRHAAQGAPMETSESRVLSEPTEEEDAHLAAAAYLLKHAGSPELVALEDEGNTPEIGMITEAELAEAKADGMDADDMPVRDGMTTEDH